MHGGGGGGGGGSQIREGGVLRFYRGFMMGAIRGIPGAATTFTTYSILMDAIS